MADHQDTATLKIKKYSNRRFYDTTRSRHVTLGEMHTLICEGHELEITDGKSGQDITNLVLTQIILERDPPKLDIFPAGVLHQLIRTQRQFMGSVVEQFFAQVLAVHKSSQEQWLRFVRNTIGVPPVMSPNPMDWTRSLMEAIVPSAAPRNEDPPQREQPEAPAQEVDALRRQVEALTRRIEQMAGEKPPGNPP